MTELEVNGTIKVKVLGVTIEISGGEPGFRQSFITIACEDGWEMSATPKGSVMVFQIKETQADN